MVRFDPESYGRSIVRLIDVQRLGQLGPGSPNRSARDELRLLDPDSAWKPHPVVDREMAKCCVAGLWLANDFLDESHSLSQAIASPSGSYWHGIMHRREPDFSNAKYWFRRVGDHPVYPSLAEAARGMASRLQIQGAAEYLSQQSDWDPFRFVDLCQSVGSGDVASQPVCREVARAEWQLLFDYCYRQTAGLPPAEAT